MNASDIQEVLGYFTKATTIDQAYHDLSLICYMLGHPLHAKTLDTFKKKDENSEECKNHAQWIVSMIESRGYKVVFPEVMRDSE